MTPASASGAALSGASAGQPRYSPAHQALHWATALGMLAVVVLAWLMRSAPEGTAFSYGLYRWHETLGLGVLALTAWRLVLRATEPPPPLPPGLAWWDRLIAHATYAVFYGLLLWMPVTGLLTTTASGFPPKLFNLVDTPALFSKSERLAAIFGALHAWAQWLVYALVLLHVTGVVFHLLVTRSGVLGRMLPANAAEPAQNGVRR